MAKRMAEQRAKRMAKPRLSKEQSVWQSVWLSKGQSVWQSPQNTLRANIKKGDKKSRDFVRIATRICRQAYGYAGRHTGDLLGLKGSVMLRLQSIF